jgi:hypothetical protein
VIATPSWRIDRIVSVAQPFGVLNDDFVPL